MAKGSGTVLAGAVILVIAVVAAAVLVVAGYVAAVHHVRAAADLVALSGAVETGQGRDPCPAAARVAATNAVRLVRCRQSGDSLDFVVSVTVEQRVAAPSPLLPGTVVATAHAGRLGALR